MKQLEEKIGYLLLGIGGFLSVMVINDHASITASNQWQADHGSEIDQDHSTISSDHTTITQLYSIVEGHWKPQETISMADTTNL